MFQEESAPRNEIFQINDVINDKSIRNNTNSIEVI